MGLNDSVFIYDGDGTRWSGLFNGKDAVKSYRQETKKEKNFLTAVVPILKKARFEFLVQKLDNLEWEQYMLMYLISQNISTAIQKR